MMTRPAPSATALATAHRSAGRRDPAWLTTPWPSAVHAESAFLPG